MHSAYRTNAHSYKHVLYTTAHCFVRPRQLSFIRHYYCGSARRRFRDIPPIYPIHLLIHTCIHFTHSGAYEMNVLVLWLTMAWYGSIYLFPIISVSSFFSFPLSFAHIKPCIWICTNCKLYVRFKVPKTNELISPVEIIINGFQNLYKTWVDWH